MRNTSKSVKHVSGFTLLEVSIVLVIVGFLTAGGINLMSSTNEVAKYKETERHLQEVKDALTTFYIQYRFLPCPDTDNNPTSAGYGKGNYVSGSESIGGVCTNDEGWLPHTTLGIGGAGDAWGERFRYVTNKAFTEIPGTTSKVCIVQTPPYSRATTARRIKIYDLSSASDNAPSVPSSGSVVGDYAGFALISTGKNGRQTNSNITTSSSGAFVGCPLNVGSREKYHCTAAPATQDIVLRQGIPMTDSSAVVFDDMIAWQGDMQLISELRNAGACSSTTGGTGGGSTAPSCTCVLSLLGLCILCI